MLFFDSTWMRHVHIPYPAHPILKSLALALSKAPHNNVCAFDQIWVFISGIETDKVIIISVSIAFSFPVI